MKERLVSYAWILMAIAVMVVSFTLVGERATAAVPFQKNVEIAIQSKDLPHTIEAAEQERFEDIQREVGDGIVLNLEEFLQMGLPLADNEVAHKTFRKSVESPRHIYWITIFDGKGLVQYEEKYSPPPSPIKHTFSGYFDSVSDDSVIFRYNQWYKVLGLFVGLIMLVGGLIVSSIYRGIQRLRKQKEEFQNPSA